MDNINKWLTLVANAGVFLGIIFLAYEIQLSRNATEADVYQNRTELRSNADLDVALNSPIFHEILFNFQESVSELGPDGAVASLSQQDRFLIGLYHRSLMVRFDNVVFQYNNGFISDSYYEDTLAGMRNYLPTWKALGEVSNSLFDTLENAARIR